MHCTAAIDTLVNYILSPPHVYHRVLLKKTPYLGWQNEGVNAIYLSSFHSALYKMCASKQLNSGSTIAAAANSILDSVVGEKDTCECF
jgi:hypothetical protein